MTVLRPVPLFAALDGFRPTGPDVLGELLRVVGVTVIMHAPGG
ncbi:hypothetical protein [Pseudokineococcus sp. 1T1Z-3]